MLAFPVQTTNYLSNTSHMTPFSYYQFLMVAQPHRPPVTRHNPDTTQQHRPQTAASSLIVHTYIIAPTIASTNASIDRIMQSAYQFWRRIDGGTFLRHGPTCSRCGFVFYTIWRGSSMSIVGPSVDDFGRGRGLVAESALDSILVYA